MTDDEHHQTKERFACRLLAVRTHLTGLLRVGCEDEWHVSFVVDQ